MVKYNGDLKREDELAKLSWPGAPKIVTPIPGPKSKEILAKEDSYETVTDQRKRSARIYVGSTGVNLLLLWCWAALPPALSGVPAVWT